MNMFFCGLEVFVAVMITVRLGTSMVFSPFKVLFSKKNLKGTFQVHLLFTAVGATIIYQLQRITVAFSKACSSFASRKPHDQHFSYKSYIFAFLILSFLFFHYTNYSPLCKGKVTHLNLCLFVT